MPTSPFKQNATGSEAAVAAVRDHRARRDRRGPHDRRDHLDRRDYPDCRDYPGRRGASVDHRASRGPCPGEAADLGTRVATLPAGGLQDPRDQTG